MAKQQTNHKGKETNHVAVVNPGAGRCCESVDWMLHVWWISIVVAAAASATVPQDNSNTHSTSTPPGADIQTTKITLSPWILGLWLWIAFVTGHVWTGERCWFVFRFIMDGGKKQEHLPRPLVRSSQNQRKRSNSLLENSLEYVTGNQHVGIGGEEGSGDGSGIGKEVQQLQKDVGATAGPLKNTRVVTLPRWIRRPRPQGAVALWIQNKNRLFPTNKPEEKEPAATITADEEDEDDDDDKDDSQAAALSEVVSAARKTRPARTQSAVTPASTKRQSHRSRSRSRSTFRGRPVYTSLSMPADVSTTQQSRSSWMDRVDPLRNSRNHQHPNESLMRQLLRNKWLRARSTRTSTTTTTTSVSVDDEMQQPTPSSEPQQPADIGTVVIDTAMGNRALQQQTKQKSSQETLDEFAHTIHPLLQVRGMDVFLTPENNGCEIFDVGNHEWLVENGLRRVPTLVMNGVTQWGNILVYFELPSWVQNLTSSLQERPDDSESDVALKRFLAGTDEYRNARLKMIPSVVDGPLAVKVLAPPKKERVVHGAIVPLSWYMHDVDAVHGHAPVVVCAMDCVSGRVIRSMAGIVKKYLVKLTLDLVMILGPPPSTEQGGKDLEPNACCLGWCRFDQIDVAQCPCFPTPSNHKRRRPSQAGAGAAPEEQEEASESLSSDDKDYDIAQARRISGISQQDFEELQKEEDEDDEALWRTEQTASAAPIPKPISVTNEPALLVRSKKDKSLDHSNLSFGETTGDREKVLYGGSDGTWSVIELDEKTPFGSKKPGAAKILVSNPQVSLPKGLTCFDHEFLSESERKVIHKQIIEQPFGWEGFDQRRRVWRFSLAETNREHGGNRDGDDGDGLKIPASLRELTKRMQKETNLRADSLVVEEYPVAKMAPRTGEYSSQQRVTTFESARLPNDGDGDMRQSWFVAQLSLNTTAIQHINLPDKRVANSWKLKSVNHQTDLCMKPGSLWIKTGECLFDWRYQLRAFAATETGESALVIKWSKLPRSVAGDSNSNHVSEPSTADDSFGYIPNPELIKQRQALPMPPLRDLLTIIITTSPIKSNPSTEVIERCMETFVLAGHKFAYECRKVIVCDGYRVLEEGCNENKVSKKYTNAKQNMRNGIVDDEQAIKYGCFKEALRRLCRVATTVESSAFHNTVVEELEERQGYGFALRHALRNCVQTPFVCVVQHDRTFMRPTPMYNVLECMWRYPGIKYVGLSMRSNLSYRDIFIGKYGRLHADQFRDMIIRPPELLVDAKEFGPASSSARAMKETVSPVVWKSIEAVANAYWSTHQYVGQQEWLEQSQQRSPLPVGRHQMSLTPTLFWYDNIHVCETAHYRDFIFNPSYKMVARGGFVEDKLSPVIIRTVQRLGLKEGHARFGCYLLDDHSGYFFTGHLDGGSFLTASQKEASYPKRQQGPKRNGSE